MGATVPHGQPGHGAEPVHRPEPVRAPDAWDRLTPVWHWLLLATLLLATGVTLADPGLTARSRLVCLALAGGFALWHWLVVVRNPHWWERRLGPLAGYWLVVSALLVALVTQSPTYSIVLYGLYPLMIVTLGWWGLVPVAGVTAVTGWAAGVWSNGSGAVLSVLTSGGVAALVTAFVSAIARQSEQRRDALAALAATRAQLAQTSRRAGALEERERLARELHDTLAQGFTSVVTQLESAEQAFDERPEDARAHVRKASRTARDSLTEVRRAVRALRPELLDGASLPAALERATQRFTADCGVPVDLRVTGTPATLRPQVETTLLRALQEALANVVRHSRAQRVVVSLSYLGNTVTLDVDDDGVGFGSPAGPRADGGYGLVGMRERVAALGGELSVESVPGEGTTIAVTVPA